MKETCGNCKHTDNRFGIFALHCDMQITKEDDGKMRSHETCIFKPSRWERRGMKK